MVVRILFRPAARPLMFTDTIVQLSRATTRANVNRVDNADRSRPESQEKSR